MGSLEMSSTEVDMTPCGMDELESQLLSLVPLLLGYVNSVTLPDKAQAGSNDLCCIAIDDKTLPSVHEPGIVNGRLWISSIAVVPLADSLETIERVVVSRGFFPERYEVSKSQRL